MMPVAIGSGWAGFVAVTTGAATASATGEVLTCTSIVGDTARFERRMLLAPGEVVDVSVMARRTSGSDDTSGGIAIDWPSVGTNVNRVRVTSSEWAEYRLSFAAPVWATASQYVTISFGVFTADAGTCEFAWPRVSVSETPFGAPRCFALALIKFDAGTPTIATTHARAGVLGLSYSAGSKTLTLTLRVGANQTGVNPVFFGQLQNQAAVLPLDLKIGNWDYATGTVEVQFTDTTTGAAEDISGYGVFYFSFMAVL